ncbi:MAG: DUF1648 domain-containing protein [Actinomycetales bacterium]|nr:DUF1648 domain-containing protein [Actinomycetales bacterium]
MTRTPVPHRLTNALWTLAVPLVLAGTAVALVLSWRDRLPDPVAVHWGPDGVDGVGGLTELVLPLAIAVPVLAVGMWALGHFLGRAGLTRRLAAASAVWTGAYVSGVTLTTAAVQLDRADASQAGSLGVGMTVSLVAACALALLAGRLTPGDRPQPASTPVPAGAARLPLGTDERASWVRSAGQGGTWVIVAFVAVTVALLGWATRSWVFPVAFALFLGLLIVGFTQWTVSVDARGLTAVGRLGWPRQHVPLDEVESASVREIHPVREFGGWGLRTSVKDGATGVVLRSGPGIEVQRTGGRRFVVTVDDAETGAALLNTLAARSR